MVPSRRICVVFAATIVAGLGSVQTAQAQDSSPAPPAQAAADEPPAGDPTPAPPPASDPQPPASDPQPEPPIPEPAPPEPAAGADPTPPAASDDSASTPPDSAPPAESDAAAVSTAPPVAAEPTAAPEGVVVLEDAAAPPAAPAAAAAATEPPAATTQHVAPPASASATITIVLAAEVPAAEPEAFTVDLVADSAAAATDDTAPAVSFGPRHEGSTVALLADDYSAVVAAKPAPAAVPAAPPTTGFIRPTCSRPRARVPLSQRCKQARAAAVLRSTLVYAPTLQVRAAINRIAARLTATARRIESRAPPDSKAAKKQEHPVANVRPTIPFGYSGQGDTRDAFGGSSGSGWSSRLFALAAVPLRVPMPHRFARLRLPSTIPHGVIAAPPTTRPG